MARHFLRVVALIFFKTCMLYILLIKYSSESVIYLFICLLGQALFSFMPHTNVSAVMRLGYDDRDTSDCNGAVKDLLSSGGVVEEMRNTETVGEENGVPLPTIKSYYKGFSRSVYRPNKDP